jgi:non-specific protein-tyrosine kinase
VPLGSGKMTTVITAAAIGFVLAASAAYLLEYLDDSIKSPDDIRRVCDLPTLAGIATINPGAEEGSLITRSQPRSPISEAFRIFRTGIQFSSVDKPRRKLLITSANPGEGKSTTAANLAVVMAQAGHKVLLIDADLRRPTQHKIFNLSQQYGLTTLLLQSQMTDTTYNLTLPSGNYTQETDEEGLYVLVSGPIPPNPSELLGSVRMKAALDVLAAGFDILIIDSPPVLALADAIVLGTQTDGVILVTLAKKTRQRQLKQAADKLREVNAHLIGVVINRVSTKGGVYDYYYYQSSYYPDEPVVEKKVEFAHKKRGINGMGSLEKLRKKA